MAISKKGMEKDIANWVEGKQAQAGERKEDNIKMFFRFKQPRLALAQVYAFSSEDKEFSVKELENLSGIPYSTGKAILTRFVDFGIVKSRMTMRKTLYKGNRHNLEKAIRMVINLEKQFDLDR